MAAPLPRAVMVWFGSPIVPRRCSYPPTAARHDITDPPLQVDELAGLLTGWQHHHGSWRGQVEYQFPFHGYGMALRLVGWFPADRLRIASTGLRREELASASEPALQAGYHGGRHKAKPTELGLQGRET